MYEIIFATTRSGGENDMSLLGWTALIWEIMRQMYGKGRSTNGNSGVH